MTKFKKILWAPLKVGDIVDIIAPGFATTEDKVQGAVQFLKDLKLRPRVPSDLFVKDVICSNTDERRFFHLKHALQAKDSKAIWCLRGGYGALRIIESVMKLKKPQKNKLFIGYSDATTLHNYFNQFWGFTTLHGPLLDRLGQRNLPPDQVNEVLDVIFGRRSEVVFKNLHPLNNLAAKKNRIQSSISGGNLTVVQSHLGTKFAKKPTGQILFFEDIGERGYRVDRMLKHLEMAGYFKGVKAILFGEFINSEEPTSAEPTSESLVPRVIERFAQNIKIPVFCGVEVGHGSLQRPLPLGTHAALECGPEGNLTVATGADLR